MNRLIFQSSSVSKRNDNEMNQVLQVTKFKKYKFWNPKVRRCIVIDLSCTLLTVELLKEPIRGHLETITDKKPDFGGSRIFNS